MNRLKNFVNKFERHFAKRNNHSYIKYLRKIGVEIGENVTFLNPKEIYLDTTRTSLISIGADTRINPYVTILTHDAVAKTFRKIYNDWLPSSGMVKIGENVYIAQHCTIMKGVTIGNNCIIGYGSTVIKDIPDNSVAVGTPAKVVCSIDDYYKKRKEKSLEEAFVYARSIKRRFHRNPVPSDFNEEFVFFVDRNNINEYSYLPIKYQLGVAYEKWISGHKAIFSSFEQFLMAAGIKI